ncbi:MAG: alpha-ketoglutarate-dependent dioxygenase AlkB [Proteobacteria bacterium]|nr:alpha-ketoglutarate-dependent dioxygenase AlkB [Pseudomonadota bacterium]
MQQRDWLDPSLDISRKHLAIRLLPEFISSARADILLKHLIDNTPWQQPRVKVYGKWHPTPRLVSFYADEKLSYGYSQTLHGALPLTTTLFDLKTRISQLTSIPFNAVLLNYYRDGRDTMGWHADDEKELGVQPTIASLSLGAARDIHFKSRNGGEELVKLNLPSGSLLIMDGDTQHYWLHHIPKRAKCTTPRVNLTFRNIGPA